MMMLYMFKLDSKDTNIIILPIIVNIKLYGIGP